MSKITLRKVGSSYVMTIPSELVQELHLKEGQKFEVTKVNGRLVLTSWASSNAPAAQHWRLALPLLIDGG